MLIAVLNASVSSGSEMMIKNVYDVNHPRSVFLEANRTQYKCSWADGHLRLVSSRRTNFSLCQNTAAVLIDRYIS